MANQIYAGSEGTVYIGNVAVASIRSFSLEETQETIDATTMNVSGVPFRTNKATFKSWSGTVDVFWTLDDTNNDLIEQGATYDSADDSDHFGLLQPGSDEVTITFWPAGRDDYSADPLVKGSLGYTASCIITSRTISSSVDGMVEATVSVLGTTALETVAV